MSEATKVYLALGVAALVIWWAYSHQAIAPVVSEQQGALSTGSQP